MVPGLVGAERRQRPRRHPVARRCATTRPAAGGSPGRRRGRHAARSARTSSGCSAATPTAERHRGLTYFLVDLSTPGVTVRPVERLDGDEGFAEVFFDDVFVPDADVLGDAEPGLGGRDGDHRFRARAHAALARPLPGDRATADRPVPRSAATIRQLRDRLVAAWIDAEAYRWQTFWTVTRIVEGSADRRGVEPGEAVLVRARRPRCTSSRSTCSVGPRRAGRRRRSRRG